MILMTMGIEFASCLTARVTCVPGITITSTFSRTTLRAVSRTRSSRSAKRVGSQLRTFWAILCLRSLSPFSNACQTVTVLSGQSKVIKATRSIFLDRWASDACSMEHMPSVIASPARRGHGAGRTSIKSRVRVNATWILVFCAPEIAEELSIFPHGVCGVLCARKSESVVTR